MDDLLQPLEFFGKLFGRHQERELRNKQICILSCLVDMVELQFFILNLDHHELSAAVFRDEARNIWGDIFEKVEDDVLIVGNLALEHVAEGLVRRDFKVRSVSFRCEGLCEFLLDWVVVSVFF